jgi:hypothetical protein
MSFVIDASVAVAWTFEEKHVTAELTFARDDP